MLALFFFFPFRDVGLVHTLLFLPLPFFLPAGGFTLGVGVGDCGWGVGSSSGDGGNAESCFCFFAGGLSLSSSTMSSSEVEERLVKLGESLGSRSDSSSEAMGSSFRSFSGSISASMVVPVVSCGGSVMALSALLVVVLVVVVVVLEELSSSSL